MNIGIGVPTDMNDSARMIWPDGDGWGRMHGDLGTGPLRGDEVYFGFICQVCLYWFGVHL